MLRHRFTPVHDPRDESRTLGLLVEDCLGLELIERAEQYRQKLTQHASSLLPSLSPLNVSCFFLPLFSPFDANSCLLNSNAECTSLGLVFPGEFVQFGIEKTWDLWILNFTRGLLFPYSSPARQWDICINAIFGYASRRFRVTSHRVIRKSFFSSGFLLSFAFGQYNEIARIVTFIALNTDFPNCFENFGRKRIMKQKDRIELIASEWWVEQMEITKKL